MSRFTPATSVTTRAGLLEERRTVQATSATTPAGVAMTTSEHSSFMTSVAISSTSSASRTTSGLMSEPVTSQPASRKAKTTEEPISPRPITCAWRSVKVAPKGHGLT